MFELLKPIYETQDNYKIIDNPNALEPDLAVIYFSSVGWCSEKNVQTRIAEDYYEFRRNPIKRAGRHIYIRELALVSYGVGINPTINTIDKLLDLLREKTVGYKKIVTMGSSGGGYMAMIAGACLKAQYVLSLSGPIELTRYVKYFQSLPDWVNWDTPERNKYVDIVELVAQSNVPVYQFEAIRSTIDIYNWNVMLKMSNARVFSLNNNIHGGPLDPACLGVIINQTFDELEKNYHRFSGRIISKWQINRALLSFPELCKTYFKKICKDFFKIKFNKKESLVVLFGITFYAKTKNKLI